MGTQKEERETQTAMGFQRLFTFASRRALIVFGPLPPRLVPPAPPRPPPPPLVLTGGADTFA